ncbi:MAG TPA: DoxX family protein [Candidatus Dormibacteraeota bacterium]|nr:DoxX family protein [Candidatus Dormibacteraeota bacterium]
MLLQVVAWSLQALLAAFFVFHAVMFLFAPEPLVARMRDQGRWPPAIPTWFRRFIGVAELLGAIALIGPAAARFLPWLTPLAAICLALVAVSATVYHLRRHEPPAPVPFAVLALAVFCLRWLVVPVH